jgi:DNA-binding beta-propeller fold protein YncE
MSLRIGFGIAVIIGVPVMAIGSAPERQWLPTGASITPLAVPGTNIQNLNPALANFPDFVADHAVAEARSPDGNTLLVLTSGYNRNFAADGKPIADASGDFVFVFDASGAVPRQTQALVVPKAFLGLAFSPDGEHFFVSGGDDDNIHVFERDGAVWHESGAPISLGHAFGVGATRSVDATRPAAAGLAATADGTRLVVANFNNDSITVVDWVRRQVIAELDLRPGKIDPKAAGARGGTFPYGVAIRGSDTAYVSSVRDREIAVVELGDKPKLRARIGLRGNPNQLLLTRAGTRLYVAEDNTDEIAVIDTRRNRLLAEWSLHLRAPGVAVPSRGVAPDGLALSTDEHTLYVAAGGINAIAVLSLGSGKVHGLIPTGWYPTAVSVARDDARLYIVNGKSPEGPNPDNCTNLAAPPATATRCPANRLLHAANDYVLQHSKAALATVPIPDASTLAGLTDLVNGNNRSRGVLTAQERNLFHVLRERIHHVIYIVKENRTYDQILGDLPIGNGDPTLAQFPVDVTPNQHRIASDFVDLDNFYDSGEVSGTGWPWSVAGRTTDVVEKTIPPYYAGRGFSYDSEGTNRDVNVGLATTEARIAANPLMQSDRDVLAGASDVAAPDGPEDEERERGYLWDAALRAHLRLRNYGFFIDLARYGTNVPEKLLIPLDHDPAARGIVVSYASNPTLAPHTDPYFRGFDNRFADYYRYTEWAREFSQFETQNRLPQLELVRFMHDHTGDFGIAADGVNTPDRQVADNDYAVGLLIERVAHSRYAGDTLIFVVEDDAQDGPDHVDAHRSVAFVVGPYVKHSALVSARYTTVDLVRTIELVLGLRPLNLHDALAAPMTEVFDLAAATWNYEALVPLALRATELPLPPAVIAAISPQSLICRGPERDAGYWAQQTVGMDFTAEDRVDSVRFNHVLWVGQHGDVPYPATRSGANLRADRSVRLADWMQTCRRADR